MPSLGTFHEVLSPFILGQTRLVDCASRSTLVDGNYNDSTLIVYATVNGVVYWYDADGAEWLTTLTSAANVLPFLTKGTYTKSAAAGSGYTTWVDFAHSTANLPTLTKPGLITFDWWIENVDSDFIRVTQTAELTTAALLYANQLASLKSAIETIDANVDTINAKSFTAFAQVIGVPAVNAVSNPLTVSISQFAESPDLSWTITDADGDPTSLAGKTVKLIVVNPATATKAFQANGSVGGSDDNVVSVTLATADVASAGTFKYELWNMTDNQLLATGPFVIHVSEQDQIA